MRLEVAGSGAVWTLAVLMASGSPFNFVAQAADELGK
jgi:hypothetical protein